MTTAHSNYLRMIITARGVMDYGDNPAIWDGNTWVVVAKSDVQTILDRILANEGITEEDLHGNTENKETLWMDAAKLGVHMNIGTKVWAENKTVPDPVLAAEMHYTISDLDRGAIQDVLVKLNFIKGKVGLIPVLDLPHVNITALDISTFNDKIDSLTLAAPQSAPPVGAQLCGSRAAGGGTHATIGTRQSGVAPEPENDGLGHSRRRDCPRFQQYPFHHQRLRPNHRRQSGESREGPHPGRPDQDGGGARLGYRAGDARVQPGFRSGTCALRHQPGGGRHREIAGGPVPPGS